VAGFLRELEEAAGSEAGEDEEIADVIEHYNRLRTVLDSCDGILEELRGVESCLVGLQEQHDAVVDKTSALHSECEELLRAKAAREEFATKIAERLAVYDRLDELQRRLGLPTLAVGSAEFTELLAQADSAIAEISAHAHFADSANYLARFRQAQQRAMAMVKAHVAATLQSASAKARAEQPAEGEAARAVPLAAYVQYQSVADSVLPLLTEVARRAEHSREYRALLAECQAGYVAQRLQLLEPSVGARLGAALAAADLREAVRGGCEVLCDLCLREQKLHARFFPAADGADQQGSLDALLSPFCTALVDQLRPLYLKTLHVDTLCALAAILKSEVLEGQIDLRGGALDALRPHVARLLHEVQERLTFRAQVCIRDEIEGFAASKADLDYPTKLHAAAGAAGADGVALEAWCTVLPRTLTILAQLYHTVDRKIFEGLAQDAVMACTEALVAAARAVERARGRLDGALFLVMHLLKLREQIVPFDVDFSSNEIALDFTNTRSSLARMLKSGAASSWSGALSSLAGAPPKVYRTQRNSKKELERELKAACEALIVLCAGQMAEPAAAWVRKADAIAGGKGSHLRDSAFAQPDKVKEAGRALRAAVAAFRAETLPAMELYLAQPQTRAVLLAPIRAGVLDSAARFEAHVAAAYAPDECAAMQLPTRAELEALLAFAGAEVPPAPPLATAAHPPLPTGAVASGAPSVRSGAGVEAGGHRGGGAAEAAAGAPGAGAADVAGAASASGETGGARGAERGRAAGATGVSQDAAAAEKPQPEVPAEQAAPAATPAPAAAPGGSGKVMGGGQLPPGFVFQDGDLKYVGT
jgi:hypothetical protein